MPWTRARLNRRSDLTIAPFLSQCNEKVRLQTHFCTLCASAVARCDDLLPRERHVTMQLYSPTPIQSGSGGGRVSSPRLRDLQATSDEFAGLEDGVGRYDLLLLVKKVGKLAGFTPRMISLLDYYMAYTRDIDWQSGSRPIVYQSLSRTALDLGVSERQIQKLERQLCNVGAITWHDSGNHKRYGQRDATTDQIVYAYGVDLSPLASLRPTLEEKLHEKQLHDQAWRATKREISWCRCQIRGLLTELQVIGADTEYEQFSQSYQEIAVQLRVHIDLAAMRTLLNRHRSLHSRLLEYVGQHTQETPEATHGSNLAKETPKGSCRSEQEFAHYQYTTYQSTKSCSRGDARFQGSSTTSTQANDPRVSSGLQHVTLGMALDAASERVRQWLPSEPGWTDLIDAAWRSIEPLGISQRTWGEACGLLGRSGAALCLIVTDRAVHRHDNPARTPAAYFRGLLNRAKAGELRLHSSVFGHLRTTTSCCSGTGR